MTVGLEATLARYRALVDAALEKWLPGGDASPSNLHRAMRYAVLGPGKRVRPVLVYATGEALEVSASRLTSSAVAVELIHAYSLVHDDLPAMDNDDLRRGRPTCHRAFDEATAILAGDSLQALAFEVLAVDPEFDAVPARRVEMLTELAIASGARGMAGGQAIDLGAVGRCLSLQELATMHLFKTGALIRASIRLAYLAGEQRDPERAAALDCYAHAIGLAFQVQDDILDVEGETDVIGKPQGSDQGRDKPTYPNLLGLDGARATARALCDDALAALASFGDSADTLRALAEYIVRRDR
jgi:farnesyl diphosphate synthase